MLDVTPILMKGRKLLDDEIINEANNQGHRNLGNMERSLTAEFDKRADSQSMKGFIAHYAKFLNRGVSPLSANWGQFPFLVKYFISKGFDEKKAKAYAGGTIHNWMKEGMPTRASDRFSKTGNRFGFLDIAIKKVKPKVEKTIKDGVNLEIRKIFRSVSQKPV